MAESVEISDRILINRFYNLLYNEYDEYKDIFNEIGINLEITTGEIGDAQVEEIKDWIEGLNSNRVQDNEKIKMIELFERFRKISDKDDEFDNQLEQAIYIFHQQTNLFFDKALLLIKMLSLKINHLHSQDNQKSPYVKNYLN